MSTCVNTSMCVVVVSVYVCGMHACGVRSVSVCIYLTSPVTLKTL